MVDKLRTPLPAGTAPDYLVYKLIKNNHAFLKKRGIHEFSLESHNVTGKNTFAYTGWLQFINVFNNVSYL